MVLLSIFGIKDSFNELKSVRNLCTFSVLLAMNLVVRLIGTIKITPYLYVGFGFLVYLIVGSMFGPFGSCIFGFLADILGFYILGSDAPFHWGFTLNTVLGVLIYGLGLYKFKFGTFRVIVVQLIHDVVILLFLNTVWLSQMYFNNDFYKAFAARFVKQCITTPINCLLACFVVACFRVVAKALKLS